MDESALHPDANYIPDQELLDESEVIENDSITEATEVEQELGALRSTKGWQRISALMQEDIESLRTGDAVTYSPDMPMAEVGQRFVVAATTANKLQRYLDMVNMAAEATLEYQRGKSKSA